MDTSAAPNANKRKISPHCEVQEERKYRVVTRNRFECLSDTSEDESEEGPSTSSPKQPAVSSYKPTKKVVHPPPLILHDKHDHRSLVKLLATTANETFNVKYVKDSTIVQMSTAQDRNNISKVFVDNKFNFHTYTDKTEKSQSFVIRGLCRETSAEDIIRELTSAHKIAVLRCAQMKTTRWPLHMVTVSAEIKMEDISKIQILDNTKIYWEKYRSSKRITQCHNCQLWGHATSNCHAAPKCLKCAKGHLTRECTKNRETPAKCVNCNGDHPANAVACPKFQERKKWLDERGRRPSEKTQAKPQRTFEPAPTRNPWGSAQHKDNSRTYKENFPSLPPRRREQQQQQQPAPPSGGEADIGDIQELASEMKTLNELINIREIILQKVRQLNERLRNATSSQQRSQIAIQFFINLD